MKGFLSLLKAAGQTLWERTGWDATRKYLFSVIFVSVVASKILHIYTHTYYLTLNRFLVWGSTFFLQDVIFLLIARAFAGSFQRLPLRILGGVTVLFLGLYVSLLAAATISFYAVMGRDFHWGPAIGFFGDMVDAKALVIGIFGAIFFEIAILVGSYFATPYVYEVTGGFTKIWSLCVSALLRCVFRKKKQQPLPDPEVYEQIALDDHEDDKSDNEFGLPMEPPRPRENPRGHPSGSLLKRSVIISASLIIVLLSCVRPRDQGYRILSRTLAAVPFIAHAHPVFEGIEHLPGDYSWLEGHTALDTPPVLDWLPTDEPLPGFKDWYSLPLNKRDEQAPRNYVPIHYNPAKDPLHTPNLQNDILEPLREALSSGDVKVKHIILVKLESNRQDVFPLHADSYVMQRVRESYGGHIPKEVEDRLARLTPNAEHFTGFDNGFGKSEQDRPKPRGGLSAKNAYTSGTFTLKSITGSHCGLNPLAIDMNREWLYDIYQPCLPQILDAMNRQPNITGETDDWTSWPWHTMWMQSVSGEYDYLTHLMPALGFQDQMNKETIDQVGGEYAPDGSQVVGDRGYMDKVLKNYFRDVVADAERNHKRLFLSHLTGATHLPWMLPGHQSEELAGDTGRTLNDHINRYLNSLVYQDEWLTDIMNILQEAGIADDTLFVMVGDHAVSLPNDGGVTPHDSPHVQNEHVPLVFSHPKLPPVEIDLPIQSTQILPTILDLLLQTPSLNPTSHQITKDLLPMYQGQSLIRHLIPEHKHTQEWYITTLNTGGLWIALRSATKQYRVVVPLIPNTKWRFTNLEVDPLEMKAIKDYGILSLVNAVQRRYGVEAAEWLGEAVHVAKWWIEENHRRWGYDPTAPKNP